MFDTIKRTRDWNSTITNLYRPLDGADYLKLVLIFLVMVGTIVGNVTAIIAVVLNIKKTDKKAFSVYLVNLAVSDLLVCFTCMTFYFARIIENDYVFLMGPFMCKFGSFCQLLCLTSSVLTLVAIACDRSMGIRSVLTKGTTRERTGRRIGIDIASIWMSSAIISAPFFIVRQHFTLKYLNFERPACEEKYSVFCEMFPVGNKCALTLQKYYYTFISVVIFFVPICVMSVAYFLILIYVYTTEFNNTTTANGRVQNRPTPFQRSRLAFVLLIVFIACWLPYQVVIVYNKHGPVQTDEFAMWYQDVANALEFLAYFNSFCNPIIYNIRDEKFRESFRTILTCRRSQSRRSSASRGSKSRGSSASDGLQLTSTALQSRNSNGSAGVKYSALPQRKGSDRNPKDTPLTILKEYGSRKEEQTENRVTTV